MTAQETRTCDILNQTLSQNGIPHSIQYLSNSNADEFPYSLIVRLFSENKGAFRRNLFIIVPQSTAIKMQDEIISFCKNMAELEKEAAFLNEQEYNRFPAIALVLTANDYATIDLGKRDLQIPGTSTFLSNQNFFGMATGIIISDYDENSILFASSQKAAPKDLVKNILESCSQTNIKLKVQSTLLPFFRRELAKTNPILQHMMDNDIPSVHIPAKEGIFNAVEYFIENFGTNSSLSWDSQYFIFSIFNHPIFLSQKPLLIVFYVALILSLFFICFSFIIGNTAFSDLKKLQKIFYLGFLILSLFIFSFFLSEVFLTNVIKNYAEIPITTFCLKIIIAILFYLTMANTRIFLPIPQSAYLYGYLLNISSFLNIMIFSLYDLAFLPYFTLFYVINFSFWKSKNKIAKIVLFAVSIFIMLPIILHSGRYFSDIALALTDGSIMANFFLSLMLSPWVLMIVNYRVSVHKYKQFKVSEWKSFLPSILITVGVLILVLALSPILNIPANKKHINNENTIYEQEKISDYLSIEEKYSLLQDNRKVNISLKRDESVVRYIVKVGSNSLLPIFDANYLFDSFDEKNKAIFYFEENPPENLNLDFTAKSNKDLDIEIICYSIVEDEQKTSNRKIVKTVKKIQLEKNK